MQDEKAKIKLLIPSPKALQLETIAKILQYRSYKYKIHTKTILIMTNIP